MGLSLREVRETSREVQGNLRQFRGFRDFRESSAQPLCQRKRDDNENTIRAFEGGGGWAGGQSGKSSKTLFFMGNVMTIKF